MKEILLSKGFVTQVDDEDFEILSKINWYVAGNKRHKHAAGYIKGSKPYKSVIMHRLIMGCSNGLMVDHVDGNSLNSQKSNLRIATNQQNLFNCKKHVYKKPGKFPSKYKGVRFTDGKRIKKWQAYISKDGVFMHLGRFENQEDAARVYDQKAIELFGEFARPNFPGGR